MANMSSTFELLANTSLCDLGEVWETGSSEEKPKDEVAMLTIQNVSVDIPVVPWTPDIERIKKEDPAEPKIEKNVAQKKPPLHSYMMDILTSQLEPLTSQCNRTTSLPWWTKRWDKHNTHKPTAYGSARIKRFCHIREEITRKCFMSGGGEFYFAFFIREAGEAGTLPLSVFVCILLDLCDLGGINSPNYNTLYSIFHRYQNETKKQIKSRICAGGVNEALVANKLYIRNRRRKNDVRVNYVHFIYHILINRFREQDINSTGNLPPEDFSRIAQYLSQNEGAQIKQMFSALKCSRLIEDTVNNYVNDYFLDLVGESSVNYLDFVIEWIRVGVNEWGKNFKLYDQIYEKKKRLEILHKNKTTKSKIQRDIQTETATATQASLKSPSKTAIKVNKKLLSKMKRKKHMPIKVLIETLRLARSKLRKRGLISSGFLFKSVFGDVPGNNDNILEWTTFIQCLAKCIQLTEKELHSIEIVLEADYDDFVNLDDFLRMVQCTPAELEILCNHRHSRYSSLVRRREIRFKNFGRGIRQFQEEQNIFIYESTSNYQDFVNAITMVHLDPSPTPRELRVLYRSIENGTNPFPLNSYLPLSKSLDKLNRTLKVTKGVEKTELISSTPLHPHRHIPPPKPINTLNLTKKKDIINSVPINTSNLTKKNDTINSVPSIPLHPHGHLPPPKPTNTSNLTIEVEKHDSISTTSTDSISLLPLDETKSLIHVKEGEQHRNILHYNTTSITVLLMKVYMHIQHQHWKEAREVLDAASMREPNNPLVHSYNQLILQNENMSDTHL